VLLIALAPYSLAQQQQPTSQPAPAAGSQDQPQQLLSPDQLDSLVAPLALFPDPILSQVLVASTYPEEIVQAAQWRDKNSSLNGKALADAAAKQPWDASVQALVMLPDLLKRLSQDILWTSDLGNAFLAQQDGVMQSIQRMRLKAQQKGALQSNSEQTVSTTTANGQNDIVIQPANPEVVYVPQYDPAAIWGPPVYYPYPAIYYPPVTTISFGTGFALGAIWGGGGWGGWGWGCEWGHHNVVINNNFINRNHFNRVTVATGNNWVHNPAHRGGTAYPNRSVANRYRGGQGAVSPRPTIGQTEKRLNQGNMGKGDAGTSTGGSANRMGLGKPAPGSPATGPGNPARGNANRMAPDTGGKHFGNQNPGGIHGMGQAKPSPNGGPAMGQHNPSRGGANRMAPNPGGGNRGGHGGMSPGGNRPKMNGGRGPATGGGPRGGGGGHRR
jgi:hypothetical protein